MERRIEDEGGWWWWNWWNERENTQIKGFFCLIKQTKYICHFSFIFEKSNIKEFMQHAENKKFTKSNITKKNQP
jgi:hypothetical protein